MKNTFHFSTVVLFAVLLSIVFGASGALAREKRFRITFEFSEPAFKCSKIVTYRDDFHYFIENSPFSDIPYMAGVIYPKKGLDYISLLVGISKNKEEAEVIGSVEHLKIPNTRAFEIPPIGGHFKKCKVTVTPLE